MNIEFNENYLTEITQIDERSKSNSHRLDEVEEDIKDLKEKNTTLIEMSASIKNLSEGIVDIKTDVKDIKLDQSTLKNEVSELKNSNYCGRKMMSLTLAAVRGISRPCSRVKAL